jgi:hypothetical protein
LTYAAAEEGLMFTFKLELGAGRTLRVTETRIADEELLLVVELV